MDYNTAIMLDRKGLFSYLAITFGLTYAIDAILIASGFRVTEIPALGGQLAIAATMWVPALATLITIKFVTHEGFGITNFRFGSWKPYLATAVLVPAVFAIIYGLTWLLGLGQPDWQLREFTDMITQAGGDLSQTPPPELLLPLIFLSTLFFSPFINAVFGFGEEFGWRGYLLPKLLPLGKPKAYLISGIIWGLWHAPLILIGFNYPGTPILGIIAMMGLTTALGLYIGEVSQQNRSSILAGWMHGLFNSQAYGVWRILFPTVNPLLGGVTGLVGMVVWLAVGLWQARLKPGSRTANSDREKR